MIKLFELFAGYGGASFALKKAGIPFKCVGYSEINKYAIQCYEQNFHNIKNYGDITKINPDELPDFDLLTGGFPCQDVSIAGKQDLSKGRTILFNEIIRIAKVKQPKYMLLENVKGLLSNKFRSFFEYTLNELNRIGYNVIKHYDKKKNRFLIPSFNSKDYGIPQNRQRVFYICYRKDINISFKPLIKEELRIFLKDVLESEVDEKYYLKPEKVNKLLSEFKKTKTSDVNHHKEKNLKNNSKKRGKLVIPVLTPDRLNKRQNGRRFKEDCDPSFTITKQDRHGILQINNPKNSNNRVYSAEWISPTLNTMQWDNRQPKIITVNNKGEQVPNIPEIGQAKRVYDVKGITPSLNVGWTPKVYDKVVRKLTPTECFRLMGFLNDEINLEGLSDTQKYKLAGNGWDINLVSKILKNMNMEV